jgi:hypothetical protein
VLPALACLAAGVSAQITPKLMIKPFVPVGRTGHAAAFDAARGRMVVFGGTNASGNLAETIETDGTTWFRLAPATAPSARWGAVMAYDPDTRRCHLFGGFGVDNLLWSWDGTTWTSSNRGASQPLGRTGHAMTYHTTRKRLVVFGGRTEFAISNDTWEYDVTAGWAAARVTNPPPARTGAVMAMVPIVSGALMFGVAITNGNATGQSFIWQGTPTPYWQDVTGPGPSHRTEHAAASTAPRRSATCGAGTASSGSSARRPVRVRARGAARRWCTTPRPRSASCSAARTPPPAISRTFGSGTTTRRPGRSGARPPRSLNACARRSSAERREVMP